jgi:hypothetical protein
MIVGLLIGLVLGALLGAAGAFALEHVRRRRALQRADPIRRIAFPFTAQFLSEPALVAALRVARAEQATLMPVYLAMVSLDVPLDVPLPNSCAVALPMLEAIEHRAQRAEVAVDARIERGRTPRHALRRLIDHERFDRVVVAAESRAGGDGFAADDIAWLLHATTAEVMVLRPAREARTGNGTADGTPFNGHAAEPLASAGAGG